MSLLTDGKSTQVQEQTKSDSIADVLYEKAKAEFPEHRMRKDTRDNDNDKEANFWVLAQTAMSAILKREFLYD